MKKTTASASTVLVGILISVSASAQTTTAVSGPQAPSTTSAPAPHPAEGAPAKIYTVTTGMDYASAYLFRGIPQHSGGTIAQPYADVAFALDHGITADVGTWNSIHSTQPGGNYYERDYFGSLVFTAGKLKPGLLYTSYTSPADSFATVHELAGTLAIDDSKSAFPFNPKIVLAFELGDGEADGGLNKGTYLELGVRPTVKLAPKVTLAIPVKTGLSANHYYEGPTGDNRFGYFDTGLSLSVPVISGKSGTLEIHGGVDLIWLGDNMKLLNGGDRLKPVSLVGFTYTY
jgi:hypothetical protein